MKYEVTNMKHQIRKNQRGFTILESVVAIFILSLSITGVFSAVQQSLSQAILAKDEVQAFYLAQEAVEIIRNKRDANQLNKIVNSSSNSWLYGITENVADPCYFGKVCRVDANNQAFTYCGSTWNSCPILNQNTNTYLYSYTSGANWVAAKFKREIQIESINVNEIAVTVRISWSKGIINREFKAKTHLLNWI